MTSVGAPPGSIRRVSTGSWFFPAMGCVALLAVVIGFGRTYAAPMARGTLDIPAVVHVVRGAVHPVLKWSDLAVMVEQSLEVLLFDSPAWRAEADVVYGWLGG